MWRSAAAWGGTVLGIMAFIVALLRSARTILRLVVDVMRSWRDLRRAVSSGSEQVPVSDEGPDR
ncbi:hypothetical protein CG736_29710 [Kitasatospora sp. CB02891]|nr:hypothetical protein CG736_29710 [Kitasatospora sp. CB02891]